ncbi:MAG: FKBP-type peptidyl-prolyl cis-trans isomerase [Flavobacteriales bacterium]|nr:FKBP-type peptidyl-prolyl cis-trans isomerase [Flavobacteriales bacterium]
MKPLNYGAAVLALFLIACGRSPLAGGTRIADGVYWRLNTLGEGERAPSDSDSVFVRVRMARLNAPAGSLFSTERWYPMGSGRAMDSYFNRLHQGDSATALLRSSLVPWAELGMQPPDPHRDTGWVQMELSLRLVRSLAESRELAHAALMARTQADEQRILEEFFTRDDRPWVRSMGVWYALDPAAGHGPRVQSAELVTLAYKASFLDNGRVFDDQSGRNAGLTFRLGDPGQVIKGLEVAAHLLPAHGGGGWFVIPAELAFGPDGSSSGIVPPWTPVLYRVDVVAAPAGEARVSQDR